MRTVRCALAVLSLAAVAACSGSSGPSAVPTNTFSGTSPAPSTSVPSPATTSSTGATTDTPAPSGSASPVFQATAAMATVRKLAGEIGPREATSPAFRSAAAWVEQQFAALGYDVQRQSLHVPTGVSWGVPVPAGRTWNVIARPRDLRPGEPYVLVGAHLDTVPQAPGAEDNASGVAVVLETARLAATAPTRFPVVFVAFAAEEPRGTGDDRHHYGSRAMVARLSQVQRRSLRGMVALDRVGVGQQVPICNGSSTPTTTTQSLRRSARTVGVATRSCGANRSGDHWSFELAGLPAARIGSTPYAEYHSKNDLPGVVEPAQLDRVGRVLWRWLRR